MTVTELIKIITDNGVSIIVLLYFMYRDFCFQETLTTTLQALVDTVGALEDTINNFTAKERSKYDS